VEPKNCSEATLRSRSGVRGMNVPDLIEPLVGWRAWTVERQGTDDGLRLTSLYYRVVWPIGEPLVARCDHPVEVEQGNGSVVIRDTAPHDDVVPYPTCRCGVRAGKQLGQVLTYLPASVLDAGTFLTKTSVVFGRVNLWGAVEEHEVGFRAEKARPSELFVPIAFGVGDTYATDAATVLEDAYQVPTRIVRHLDDVAVAA
jgi:hypothetical protein